MLGRILPWATVSTFVLSASSALAAPAIQSIVLRSPEECGIAASKMPSHKLVSAVATKYGAICTLTERTKTFEQCIDAAGEQLRLDRRNGVDRITADNWFAALAEGCRKIYHR